MAASTGRSIYASWAGAVHGKTWGISREKQQITISLTYATVTVQTNFTKEDSLCRYSVIAQLQRPVQKQKVVRPYILLLWSFTANIWCSLCCQFSIFSILLSHLTWHDSATLQWSQNIIYDNLARLNTQKLSLSISKAYVPKEAWIFSNPAHLTNTCKHFHKARFPLRPRDFQDHLLIIHVDRLEQRISGLQSSREGFNYLCLLPPLPQGSPGLSLMSAFGCGFHFLPFFFFERGNNSL